MPHEIHSTLVLSTAHLTPATCRLLATTALPEWPVAGGPHGHGFYIYAHDEMPEGVPPDLADCLTYARDRARCDYVHFDRDREAVDALPSYDHDADSGDVK